MVKAAASCFCSVDSCSPPLLGSFVKVLVALAQAHYEFGPDRDIVLVFAKNYHGLVPIQDPDTVARSESACCSIVRSCEAHE